MEGDVQELVQIPCHKDKRYLQLCHGAINNYISRGKLVCPKWMQYKMPIHCREVKIGVFGQNGVGKSSLTVRSVTNLFMEEYDPTISDSLRKAVMIDGIENYVLVDLLDFDLQEEFSSLRDQQLRESNILLFCFAIHQKESLDHCIKDLKHYCRTMGYRQWQFTTKHSKAVSRAISTLNLPSIFARIICSHFEKNDNKMKKEEEMIHSEQGVMLVGCQMDRMYEGNEYPYASAIQIEHMRENYATAIEMSRSWNIPFIETSSKRGYNVDSLFQQAIYEYWLQTQSDSIRWDQIELT